MFFFLLNKTIAGKKTLIKCRLLRFWVKLVLELVYPSIGILISVPFYTKMKLQAELQIPIEYPRLQKYFYLKSFSKKYIFFSNFSILNGFWVCVYHNRYFLVTVFFLYSLEIFVNLILWKKSRYSGATIFCEKKYPNIDKIITKTHKFSCR